MKKGWKIVIALVLVALLLGAVCVGVGFLTGADMARIYSVLDDRYSITAYYEYAIQVAEVLKAELF